jgi:NADH-quinone oxidoreductase subunit M
MDLREIAIAVPLVVLTIAMGVLPNALVLSWMSPSVNQMVAGVVSARELNLRAPGTVQMAPPAMPSDVVKPAPATIAAVK